MIPRKVVLTNQSGGAQAAPDSSEGNILSTSTTIAGLATAIFAVFPASPPLASFNLFEIKGHLSISCGFFLLFCGIFAVISGIGAINNLRKEKNLSLKGPFWRSSLGLLFMSLFVFFVIYVGVTIKYVHLYINI